MRIITLSLVFLLTLVLPILCSSEAGAQTQTTPKSFFWTQTENYCKHNPGAWCDSTLKTLNRSEPAPQRAADGNPATFAAQQGGTQPQGSILPPPPQAEYYNKQRPPNEQHEVTKQAKGWVHAGPPQKLDNPDGPRGPIFLAIPEIKGTITGTPDQIEQVKYLEKVSQKKIGHLSMTEANELLLELMKGSAEAGGSPDKQGKAGASEAQGAGQGASDALADAFDPTWMAMLELQNEPLINVANEASGSPCASLQPIKTHNNAVWMVMQMYKSCYLPMAVLLLLPGAVMTQLKGLVSGGILDKGNDEDAVSPFAGILRALIAIFLIPATQLFLSYTIDVGNSLHYEVNRHVNPATIFQWADEQVFRAPDENKRNQILPSNMFPVLGKITQGPEQMSGVESQSAATVMLQGMCNMMAQSAGYGLVMLCAFQITMVCYLMCMGPIAAAFYAWPSGLGSLFSKVFAVWIDGTINLALWKFWWTVVLLCINTRIDWLGAVGGYSIYSQWEMLMFIAFLVILTYVPFNPFDFKAGEMVSQVMQKAEQAVQQAQQSGKK